MSRIRIIYWIDWIVMSLLIGIDRITVNKLIINRVNKVMIILIIVNRIV